MKSILAGLACITVLGSLTHAESPWTVITLEGTAPYYRPAVVTVPSYTPIQWLNPTASPHSIQHDACSSQEACAFDSGALAPDAGYVLPGLSPGRYDYHCALHPVMRGTVFVIDKALWRQPGRDGP